MSDAKIDQYDHWLDENGAVALVLRETLMPVDGADGVVFPPTFAAVEGQREGGYNIDEVGTREASRKIALIDTVGSQSNRLEPLFKRQDLRELVPQIIIKAGENEINLLDAGHRAADAIVRSSSIAGELKEGFLAWQTKGDAGKLAKIAPTSLLFGAWDSRDTQAKLPRLISSTIRAYGVKTLTRSAQYNPALDYLAAELVPGSDKKELDALSELGFRHVPASGKPGGVLVEGEIRRDVVFSLVALRALGSGDAPKTRQLQRYILGLGLVAFTAPGANQLRQGCLLVPDPDKPASPQEVARDGKRKNAVLSFESARAFAMLAASDFGIGPSRIVDFETKRAAEALKKQRESKKKAD